MLAYLSRRLMYGALVLLGVNLVTFFLFFTVNTPDDMARMNIGGKRVTQELIDKWKVERGYDKPLYFAADKQGSEQLTETIFWERSVSLFALKFGRADSESAGDIGHEFTRIDRGQRLVESVTQSHCANPRLATFLQSLKPNRLHLRQIHRQHDEMRLPHLFQCCRDPSQWPGVRQRVPHHVHASGRPSLLRAHGQYDLTRPGSRQYRPLSLR